MRTLLPFLLFLAAAGGAYVLFIDDEVRTSETTLEGEGLRDGPGAGTKTLRTKKQAVVGVWGHDGGTPTSPIDYASAHMRVLRPASEGGRVSGAAILAAFEKSVGLAVPIRFALEDSLNDFRAASLEMEDPGSVEMLEVLGWIRHMGFTVVERPSFVFITKTQAAGQPESEQPAAAPPPKPSVWSQPPARSDGK